MPDQTPAVGMERKLAAIFSTDVAGYSRLMGDDEEATIRTLTAYRAVISSLIQQYRGRVVDSPGDNLLGEFASVVDAVRCAVEMQHALKGKNEELPEHRQMCFRTGINLGDVVVEGERLYGDGVNIAARLESLALPGGICISGTVYDHVENKLALNYEYQGEQIVKNITKPVRVYRVVMDEAASALAEQTMLRLVQPEQTATPVTASPSPSASWKRTGVVLLAGLVLVVGTIAAVHYLSRLPLTSPSLTVNPATPAALPLPDKPSIAVLPFANMSGDPGQEHISDGMTEAVITDLSKLSGLFVIARNSAFTYKGKAVKVNDVGRELGVQYVLEGSVQKAENRVRITAQLVEAATGGHLWAEQYDREWKDIFVLQDELREKIVLALKVKLTPEEQARFRRAPTTNLEAYETLLRGVEYLGRSTRKTTAQAQQMFERAIELDPQYAAAYATLSMAQLVNWLMWDPLGSSLDQILAPAQKAVELDASLAAPHLALSAVYLRKKQYEQALAEATQALSLDPNYAEGYAALADILAFSGRPQEALGAMEQAMRLDPAYPPFYLVTLGHALLLTGQYEEAMAACRKALARNPNLYDAYTLLALSFSELDRIEEARAAVAALLKIQPYATLDGMKLESPYTDPAITDRYVALLQKAGLKWKWPTDNLEALRALWSGLKYFGTRTKENNIQARQWFERAIALDPQYASAHVFLGLTYFLDWVWHWSHDSQSLERAVTLAQAAVTLDESLPFAHTLLAHGYAWKRQHAQAMSEAERAVALAPDDADGYQALAEVLNFAGQSEKALSLVEKAMRLNPQYRDTYFFELGFTYQFLGRHEDAIVTLQKVVVRTPNDPSVHLELAVSYSEVGREADARTEVAELLRINPDYSLELARQRSPIKDPAVAERFITALRKAGLK